ncbi:MAG: DUF4190 domain-containing protein [Planctomycetes bacterium]|nr:DUF4190 domain-containing protein [Planctomycetota bacterium]
MSNASYPPPAPPPGPQPSAGLSIASLVLGIVSLVLFCIWWISGPCAILAIVLGAVGRSKGGKGMATAGMVCGIAAIGLAILVVAGFLAFFNVLQEQVKNLPKN